LAIRHRVAVVAVTHLRKSDGPAIYRSMGSLAFVAAARAVWAVTKDRDNPHRRLVLPVKNNLAADVMGMAYTIEAIGPSDAPVVAWEPDPIELSADDALAPEHGDDGATSAVDEAVNWLRDMLSAAPIPAGDVKHTADRDGIKARTLDRAKATLRVVAEREGFGKDGRWVWRLPHSAPTHPIERQPQGMAHNGGDGALCDLDAGGESTRERQQRQNDGA
ncbi:MAG: hypothetical protein O6933_01190, partial [Planctomycetota bacterium]|nr:hypothetical protein [Planctomycetota bacterium]